MQIFDVHKTESAAGVMAAAPILESGSAWSAPHDLTAGDSPDARNRVRLRDRPSRVCEVDPIWEQVVDAHDPVALGQWWAEVLGWVVVGDAADEAKRG